VSGKIEVLSRLSLEHETNDPANVKNNATNKYLYFI
jgi:hypothetical protein